MTHLKIEQNNTTEYLNNDSVIRKICDIIDNDNLDETSRLSGTIHISNQNNNAVAYDKHIDKINNDHDKCQDLTVSADNVYIWFEDSNVEAALKACYNLTSEGVMSSQIGDANVHYMNAFLFQNSNNNNPNQYGQAITSFNELSKLTNITKITDKQFQNCANLTSIDLSNITEFDLNNNAVNYFAGCTSLTNLGDISKLRFLGNGGAFSGSGLTSIELSSLITVIPGSTFYRCRQLTQVTGGGSVTKLEGNCFYECDKLTTIPLLQNVTSIGTSCFSGCSSLTQADLSTNLTSLPASCFKNCNKLTTITGFSNITQTGNDCFNGCSKLTTITPSFQSVTSIGNGCFSGCSSLQQINLSTTLTTIPNNCFYKCGSLTTVTGLSNITQLNHNSFDQCSNLTNIDDLNWNNLTRIGPYAFNNCNKLEYTVDLSSVGGELGQYAFNNCSKITVTNLPKSTYYGNSAFLGVKVPVNMTIPKEVGRMDQKCFQNCTLIETVQFEQNSQITRIDGSCFQGCTSLQSIIFPEGLTTVGSAAFCQCILLRYVEFPTTLTYLGANQLFGHGGSTNNAGVTQCTIVFKSTTPPTLGADNSYQWEHVFGRNNCVSNNAIDSINTNTIYVPDGYVSDYQSSFQSAIESSGASGTQYNKFMLFISNQIKPMSQLPST